jgi:lysophospholipase L1-like esterase
MNPHTRKIPRIAVAMLAAAALAVSLASGCAAPTAPTAQLQIACPAVKDVESLTGSPVHVEFAAATAQGGTAPINISCTPTTGSEFPVGTTTVTCTATDAKQKSASCSLPVTVTQVGTLSATRFMAFGDSITEGKGPSSCDSSINMSTLSGRLLDLRRMAAVSPRGGFPGPYPELLQKLLAERYVTQAPVVINEGRGGETVTDGGGTNDDTFVRLRQRLNADSPQVVLLQEGINDINTFWMHMADRLPPLEKGLRDMIREIKSRGAKVMLGTLLPEDQNGCRGKDGYDLVVPANDLIKGLAASEGVTLVDLYTAFGSVPSPLIGAEDGLHPTALGYQKMADTFLDAIKKNLETPH